MLEGTELDEELLPTERLQVELPPIYPSECHPPCTLTATHPNLFLGWYSILVLVQIAKYICNFLKNIFVRIL